MLDIECLINMCTVLHTVYATQSDAVSSQIKISRFLFECYLSKA